MGKKRGREVEEAAEIEEETCRKARGSKRRRGLSDAMSENLTGIKLGGRYLVGRLGTWVPVKPVSGKVVSVALVKLELDLRRVRRSGYLRDLTAVASQACPSACLLRTIVGTYS